MITPPPEHEMPERLSRRRLLQAAAAVGAAAVANTTIAAPQTPKRRSEICFFIKFLQSLSYQEMAERVAELGFDGIESTVRANGHVLPERVKDDLPRQFEAVKKAGIDITIVTTDVTSVDQPHAEDVLRTAASLGLKKYRLGFRHYKKNRGVLEQLDEFRPRLKELAALNRELGLTGVYQNHSGPSFIGGPIWDLRYLLEGIPPEEIGMAFDLRHATVEGGLNWPVQHRLMEPHIGAYFVKDFVWSSKRPRHVPLGEGRVDASFYSGLAERRPDVPLSLHVEYGRKMSVAENLVAIKRDFATLQKWLQN